MRTETPHLDPFDELDGEETPLPTYAVTARFRVPAEDAAAAEAKVRADLAPVQDLYEHMIVEPQEPDGRWAVDVRIVTVSVDNETAVLGVHTSLQEAGVTPDETWVSRQLT